jgi:hypothetical protein
LLCDWLGDLGAPDDGDEGLPEDELGELGGCWLLDGDLQPSSTLTHATNAHA